MKPCVSLNSSFLLKMLSKISYLFKALYFSLKPQTASFHNKLLLFIFFIISFSKKLNLPFSINIKGLQSLPASTHTCISFLFISNKILVYKYIKLFLLCNFIVSTMINGSLVQPIQPPFKKIFV